MTEKYVLAQEICKMLQTTYLYSMSNMTASELETLHRRVDFITRRKQNKG